MAHNAIQRFEMPFMDDHRRAALQGVLAQFAPTRAPASVLGPHTRRRVDLVVSRYLEPVQWIHEASERVDRVFLYEKGSPTDEPLPPNVVRIQLPNIGRESQTIFFHLLSEHWRGAGVTCFVQGTPFDHSPNLLSWLGSGPDDVSAFQSLAEQMIHEHVFPEIPDRITERAVAGESFQFIEGALRADDLSGHFLRKEQPGVVSTHDILSFWNWMFAWTVTPPDPIYFSYGAHFAVKSELVSQRPYKWWQHLSGAFSHPDFFHNAPWILETMWRYLFDLDLPVLTADQTDVDFLQQFTHFRTPYPQKPTPEQVIATARTQLAEAAQADGLDIQQMSVPEIRVFADRQLQHDTERPPLYHISLGAESPKASSETDTTSPMTVG